MHQESTRLNGSHPAPGVGTRKRAAEPEGSRQNIDGHLWLKPSDLVVDPDVQRNFDETHAKNLAREYDPALFGIGHASLRTDGRYYVLDGQHRIQAAILANHGHTPVLFRVYTGLTKDQEAKKFIDLNSKKKAIHSLDVYRLQVKAKNPIYVEVDRILTSFGLRVAAYRREGGISAVGALVNIYLGKVGNKPGKLIAGTPLPQGHLLSRTLNILSTAWKKERDAFDGILLNGVAAALHKHGADLDSQRMSHVLARTGTPTAVIGRIRSIQEMSRKSIAQSALEHIETLYQRGARGTPKKLKAVETA